MEKEIINDSYIVLTYENGWYHFYIHGNNKPNTDECIKSKYTVYKNSNIKYNDGILEVTGYEYIKNGIVRDSEVRRFSYYSGNFKIHVE